MGLALSSPRRSSGSHSSTCNQGPKDQGTEQRRTTSDEQALFLSIPDKTAQASVVSGHTRYEFVGGTCRTAYGIPASFKLAIREPESLL